MYLILLLLFQFSHSEDTFQEVIERGIKLYNSEEYERALKVFEDAEEKYGENDYVFYQKANIHLKLENYENAISEVQLGLKFNLNNIDLHLLLGEIYFNNENKKKSMMCFYYYLLLNPDKKQSSEVYTKILNFYIRENYKDIINSIKNKPQSITYSFNSYDPRNSSQYLDTRDQVQAFDDILKLFFESQIDVNSLDAFFLNNTIELINTFEYVAIKVDQTEPDIVNNIYINLFKDMVKDNQIDTFCYYISQTTSDCAAEWLNENPFRIEEFIVWLQGG